MNEDIQDDVQLVMQHIYNDTKGTHDNEPEEEIIHVHHFPDAQLIELPDGTVLFKKSEDTTTNIPIVESEPHDSPATQPFPYLMLGIVLICCIPMLASNMLQIYLLQNPPIATLTIFPKSQQLTLTGTLQLGRVLNTITLSQSSTVPTTGHGHQDARAATGTVTFYNGQLTSVFIPAGTTLTGNSGVQIITDQDANIPAESGSIPPTLGQATIPAHAVTPGSNGNIPVGDINQGCCATAIKVVNTAPFSGGKDKRDFRTVTNNDISQTAAPLKANLAQSINGALQGQLKTNEGIVAPSCTTTTTSNHQIGQEATQVKVTVSETCSAVAYDQARLQAKVTDLLTSQAENKLGSGYGLLGSPQISIIQASGQNKKVVLNFASQSRWVYAISSAEQRHIKNMIAGKSKDTALQLLLSLPDIQSVRVQFSGFGDDTSMPKHTVNIHLALIYG